MHAVRNGDLGGSGTGTFLRIVKHGRAASASKNRFYENFSIPFYNKCDCCTAVQCRLQMAAAGAANAAGATDR